MIISINDESISFNSMFRFKSLPKKKNKKESKIRGLAQASAQLKKQKTTA